MSPQAADLWVFLLEVRCSCRRGASAALSTCSREETCPSFPTPSPSSTTCWTLGLWGTTTPPRPPAFPGSACLSLPDTGSGTPVALRRAAAACSVRALCAPALALTQLRRWSSTTRPTVLVPGTRLRCCGSCPATCSMCGLRHGPPRVPRPAGVPPSHPAVGWGTGLGVRAGMPLERPQQGFYS